MIQDKNKVMTYRDGGESGRDPRMYPEKVERCVIDLILIRFISEFPSIHTIGPFNDQIQMKVSGMFDRMDVK